MIRIVVADDHPVVLSGLEGILAAEPDMKVVAKSVNGAEALKTVLSEKPDILLVDLHMPELDGVSVARKLSNAKAATRVILMTGEIDDDETLEALRAGVKGLVLKEVAGQVIVRCVRRVHSGGQWLDTHASGRALDTLLRREASVRELSQALTPRELTLVKLAGLGLRNKEISDQLDIGEGTVKAHLHNVYRKLGIESRVELVLYAREKGLA